MERYRHFKGGFYQVLGTASHSETQEKLVVYKSEKDNSLWVRPVEMFYGEHSPGVKRFTLVPSEDKRSS